MNRVPLSADKSRCMGRGHRTDCPMRPHCLRHLSLKRGIATEVHVERDLRDPADGVYCEHFIQDGTGEARPTVIDLPRGLRPRAESPA